MTQSLYTIKRDIYLRGQQHSRTCFIHLPRGKIFSRGCEKSSGARISGILTKRTLSPARGGWRLRARRSASVFCVLYIKRTQFGGGSARPFGTAGRTGSDGQNEPRVLPGKSYFGVVDVASRRIASGRRKRAWGSPPSGFCSRDGRHYFFSVDNSLPRCPSVFFPTAPYSHGKANAKYREERTDGTTARDEETARGREMEREKKRRRRRYGGRTARSCAVKPRQWRDPKTASRGCLFR